MASHALLPPSTVWIRSTFDPAKAAPGYDVSADGRTARLVSGAPYYTVQGTQALQASGGTSNQFYYEAVFSGLVGGIGVSRLNDKTRANLYNDESFLLSGYGDLYCFGSSIKGVSPNIARSSGTRFGVLLDMNEGTLTFCVDGKMLPYVAQHECLTVGQWYITITFGSGAAGAQFVLQEPPSVQEPLPLRAPPPCPSPPASPPLSLPSPPSPPPSPPVSETVEVATNLHVAVVGASLGGLSVANVLLRAGARVSVFELFPSGFHLRGGALGSVDVDLIAEITGDSRRVHAIRGHGHFYGDLWRHLYASLPEGTVTFGADVRQVLDPDSNAPRLLLHNKTTSDAFDLIIGADGGKSSLRAYVTSSQPSYAGYVVWRGLVPRDLAPGPPSGRAQVNGVAYETLGFACSGPAELGVLWNTGIYVATPEAEVQPPTRNRQVVSSNSANGAPEWLVPFVRKLFGEGNARYWAACATHGKVSAHPVWEMAADRVVHHRIALLGDAAHMASPRTGAGAYTAMVDAVVLGRAVATSASLNEALDVYNADTVRRGRELYQASRRAAASFAPAGKAILSPSQIAANAP